MFNSEMIVVLWSVPVVFFILMPLSMLCVWAFHQLLKKVTDKIKLIYKSSKKARDESYVIGIQSGPVA